MRRAIKTSLVEKVIMQAAEQLLNENSLKTLLQFFK